MQADLDGYTGEVGYAERFHRGTAPAWLHFVASGLGRSAPDPSLPYRWCELGCGPGLGAALLAAANPQASFHAVDFNPAHIRAGRAWAASAALGNLSFQQSSFADLAQAPAGQHEPYDYIVVTGVYAWVSPSNQQAIRAFAQRFLAPGGLVYLSYPCYPGMAEMVPIRNLLREYAQAADGDAPRRAAAALAQLRALGHAGSPWLASRPELLRALDTAGDDPAYLVHDLLAEHWQIQHVGQVVRDWMDGACSWLGSAQPADNIDAIALPGQTGPLLAGLPDDALRESARAFASSQALRHDIYQRVGAHARLDEAAHRRALLRQCLHGLPAPRDEAADPRALAAVSGPYFEPLRQTLAQGAIRYDLCAAWPPYASLPGELNAAFQLLAGAGAAHPVLQAAPDPRPAQALNLALCRASLQGRHIPWLAAPALGSAVSASPAQMAAWLALHEDGGGRAAASIVDRAWQAWRRLSAALPAKPPAAFAGALADFENEVLPCWLRLGVAADRRP